MSAAFAIRAARPSDLPDVLRLMRALAVYEKLLDKLTATEADMHEAMFGAQPKVEAALAYDAAGAAVGLALFYENFTSFACARGLYLEDLYVEEAARGQGIGKALIEWGAKLAVARGCVRYQWVVLDWNQPARDFYKSLGAEETPEWIGVRVSGEALEKLAGGPAPVRVPVDAKLALDAFAVEYRAQRSTYPEPFYSRMAGRSKRVLGDRFGLKNFGVNLTTLAPGGESALLHKHTKADEFVYIVAGEPTLVTDAGETTLFPGACAGFPAAGVAHQLVNRSDRDVVYLEVGDRTPGDSAEYPVDDIALIPGPDGKLVFVRKDGASF